MHALCVCVYTDICMCYEYISSALIFVLCIANMIRTYTLHFDILLCW